MFGKLVRNDDAVKTVFDHFRNIGIASAVFAAGVWTWTHPVSGVLAYMSFASGVSLCVIGIFLFAVAERHGHRKFQEANLPWYWELTIIVIYAFALISLFSTAALRIELQ